MISHASLPSGSSLLFLLRRGCTREDREEARRLLEIAARAGSRDAQLMLASRLAFGLHGLEHVRRGWDMFVTASNEQLAEFQAGTAAKA